MAAIGVETDLTSDYHAPHSDFVFFVSIMIFELSYSKSHWLKFSDYEHIFFFKIGYILKKLREFYSWPINMAPDG